MGTAIWVVGATGRTGRGVARRLSGTGHEVVLVGRDQARLDLLAAELDDANTVCGTLDDVVARVRGDAPGVVVNTVGPFARTAGTVAAACPAGTHYVDVGNELPGVHAVLALHDRAVSSGSTLVTGAGFGVMATEAPVLRLCADRPAPTRVRVDAIPSLAGAGGAVGEALAGSMLDSAPAGGRRVDGGRLVRAPIAGAKEEVRTPDGRVVATVSLPTGDLVAAWRASGAGSVVSATSAIPSGLLTRAAFPVVSLVLRSAAARRLAIRGLARVPIPQRARPQEFSWGRASGVWGDGSSRAVWLRLGDAQEFTEEVCAEVARRLTGTVEPGAFTPGALFGASLASDVGAAFLGPELPDAAG